SIIFGLTALAVTTNSTPSERLEWVAKASLAGAAGGAFAGCTDTLGGFAAGASAGGAAAVYIVRGSGPSKAPGTSVAESALWASAAGSGVGVMASAAPRVKKGVKDFVKNMTRSKDKSNGDDNDSGSDSD